MKCQKCGKEFPNRKGRFCGTCHWNKPTIEQQLQQAHRQGWEQAKMEAKLLSFSCSCHKAIASMEYKEAKDDR